VHFPYSLLHIHISHICVMFSRVVNFDFHTTETPYVVPLNTSNTVNAGLAVQLFVFADKQNNDTETALMTLQML